MLKVPSLPLPAGVPALLQLFEGPLAQVQFPDIDRASLSDLAERTVVASDALARARAALADAQHALGEAETQVIACEASLITKAHRALAYARVFAEGDVELTRTLGAIELAGTGGLLTNLFAGNASPAPKRRGRPKSPNALGAAEGAPEARKSAARSSDQHGVGRNGEQGSPDLFVVPAEAEREVAAAS